MDFSNSQIVKSCMDVSPNIKDYFDEERYLAEVDQPEILTPHFVEILATNLLLDELAAIGVETNQTAETIVEYPTEFNTVLDMRQAFDVEKFYQFLKSMTDEQYAAFEAEVSECNLPGDMLFIVTDFCFEHFPTDERWQNIKASAEHWWWSTVNFARHINALVDKVNLNSDKNKAIVDDSNVEEISKFLAEFAERRAKVLRFVSNVLGDTGSSLSPTILEKEVREYDAKKLRPDNLPKFAGYAARPQDYATGKTGYDGEVIEPQFVCDHRRTTPHHIEYWCSRASRNLTREHLVMLVVTMFLDGLSKEEMIQKFSYIVERYLKNRPDDIRLLKYLINVDFKNVAELSSPFGDD